MNLINYGSILEVRASHYSKAIMNEGVTYVINQFTENPKLSRNRRYTLNASTDFVLAISTDGTVSITPTATIPSGTAINFSELLFV